MTGMILRIKAPRDFPHKALAGLAVREGYHHRIVWVPEEDVEVEQIQASQYRTAKEMLEPGRGEPESSNQGRQEDERGQP